MSSVSVVGRPNMPPRLLELLDNKLSWQPYGVVRRITQEDVNDFARQTGDNQPMHVDVSRPTIAHGLFILSLLPQLSHDFPHNQDGKGGDARIMLGGFNSIRFVRPVAVGSNVRAKYALNRHRQEDVRGMGSAEILEFAFQIETETAPEVYKSAIRGEVSVYVWPNGTNAV